MIPTRWTLVLIAALAGVAALLYATHEPAVRPPMPPAEPPVAPLPLNLPPAASAAAAVPSADPQSTAPERSATAQTAAPRNGSEGYGAHIERAAAGNDPAAAWEAVQWLRQCDAQGAQRESAETLRSHGVAPDFMTQRMAELDAVERRCQTVTAAHRALVPQLAALALRAGVTGAAALLADTVSPGGLPPEQRRQALEALRRDAQNGHTPSILAAVLAPADWGLSDEERLRYVLASALQRNTPVDLGAARFMASQAGLGRQSRLTDAQLAAGLQAAKDMLQRAGFTVPP